MGAVNKLLNSGPKLLVGMFNVIAVLLILLRGVVQCCQAEACKGFDDVDSKLIGLKALPKVHYSFPLSNELMQPESRRVLQELSRITHSLSLSGEWCTESQVSTCVETCARVNRTGPEIVPSLAVNFSPWHRRFGKDMPPTDRGDTYKAEIEFFLERLRSVKSWVKSANGKFNSNVKVSALLLDCERFHVKKVDNSWNEAIRQNLDTIHKLAVEVFPQARIEWYGRGIQRTWGGDGWSRMSYFTGEEIKAPLSCSLYSVPELERMRETYRRTCHLADELGIAEVTPWVALGSGFRRGLVKKQYWEMDWPYDLIYSHQIGSELNVSWYAENPKRFAPYDRATVVVFYPAPFDRRVPSWAKHFIAYVRGATGVNDLSDLGWSEPKDSVTVTP